jgi:hypothetical protein
MLVRFTSSRVDRLSLVNLIGERCKKAEFNALFVDFKCLVSQDFTLTLFSSVVSNAYFTLGKVGQMTQLREFLTIVKIPLYVVGN